MKYIRIRNIFVHVLSLLEDQYYKVDSEKQQLVDISTESIVF